MTAEALSRALPISADQRDGAHMRRAFPAADAVGLSRSDNHFLPRYTAASGDWDRLRG
uniref:Uncharacterized protein n=1 Tax=Rhizobium meliloti TaxID=382 RepID=I2E1N7_RHIML|nr:short hypothetical protein [Sinorhizobium meliloti]